MINGTPQPTAEQFFRCRVCGLEEASPGTLKVPEMMIGTREHFDYFHCPSCSSLSLVYVPEDLGQYYGSSYYSFRPAPRRPSTGALKQFFRTCSMRGKLGSSNFLDLIASRLRPVHFHWLFPGSMTIRSRILDVGCGSGSLVREMADYGFSDLTGIDPFLPEEQERPANNPRLLRAKIDDMQGERFDVIMLHHAFEHLEDPVDSLSQIRELLSPGGRVLIRVPLSDSYAFRKYGRFWVQIDAPRHIFIPSASGMYTLAEKSGLLVEHLRYDSTEFQFSGSEAYLRGVPLGEAAKIFSQSESRAFGQFATLLNGRKDGDSGCFWIKAAE